MHYFCRGGGGGRRGRGRRRGRGGRSAKSPVPTMDQLDAELDAYKVVVRCYWIWWIVQLSTRHCLSIIDRDVSLGLV